MKKIKKRHITYIIVLGLVFFGCLWAFLASSIITHKFKLEIKSNDVQKQVVEIDGLLLTETKEGKKVWEIYADKAYYDSKQKIIILTNVIGNFWENNSVTASAKGDKGYYNTENKKVILSENSKLVYKDGTYMLGDFIMWQGRDKDIIAKGNIKIVKPQEYIIYANKAVLTENMTLFRVSGNVKSEVYREGNFKK